MGKDSNTLGQTNFRFPGQTGEVYHGKVRDVYSIDDKYVVMIATDQLSAFDVKLPRLIPHKGAILNELTMYFLREADMAIGFDTHYVDTPDLNALIVKKAKPIRLEIVVRNNLVGQAWRDYKAGKRVICGAKMPDEMKEYEAFLSPIITPTTKNDAGHDEPISKEQILSRKLLDENDWEEIEDKSRKLFALGQKMAMSRNLLLADTKYEFGWLDGNIVLIDEVHTPDSSRYFYLDSYNDFVNGKTGEKPKNLSKEFVREWLIERGFSGKNGQTIPEMTDEFVQQISDRYLELFKIMTKHEFKPSLTDNIEDRIYQKVSRKLKELGYE